MSGATKKNQYPPSQRNMHMRYIPKLWEVSVKMHTVLIKDIHRCIHSNHFHLQSIGKDGAENLPQLLHGFRDKLHQVT